MKNSIRRFLFLIPGILFFVGRLAAQTPSTIPGFLKETREGIVRNEIVGGRASGRNYSGFGDSINASSLAWAKGDCVVVHISAMGFSPGFVCGRESQDPEDKVERSQSVVPYAFYAKKYLSHVLRVRARGRNYAGLGFEEKDAGLLQLQNGSFWLLGMHLSKKERESLSQNSFGAREDFTSSEPKVIPGVVFEENLEKSKDAENPPAVVPLAQESPLPPAEETLTPVLLLEKNLSAWVANPLSVLGSTLTSETEFREDSFTAGKSGGVLSPGSSSSPDLSDLTNVRAIERRFFAGGGARGHDGISEPAYGLPDFSNKKES